MKAVNLDIPNGISVSELADLLRKKGEIRAERLLRNAESATVWDREKKVIENGKVLDVEWLKEKLEKMRVGPNFPRSPG